MIRICGELYLSGRAVDHTQSADRSCGGPDRTWHRQCSVILPPDPYLPSCRSAQPPRYPQACCQQTPVRIRPASAPKHLREPVGKFDSAVTPYDYHQGEVPRSVKSSLERKSHGESTQTPLARVNREGKTWLSTLSSPPPRSSPYSQGRANWRVRFESTGKIR